MGGLDGSDRRSDSTTRNPRSSEESPSPALLKQTNCQWASFDPLRVRPTLADPFLTRTAKCRRIVFVIDRQVYPSYHKTNIIRDRSSSIINQSHCHKTIQNCDEISITDKTSMPRSLYALARSHERPPPAHYAAIALARCPNVTAIVIGQCLATHLLAATKLSGYDTTFQGVLLEIITAGKTVAVAPVRGSHPDLPVSQKNRTLVCRY